MHSPRLIGALALLLPIGTPSPVHAADTVPAPVEIHIAASRGYDVFSLARVHGTLEKSLAAHNIKVSWVGPFPALAPQIEAINADRLDFGAGSSTAFAAALSGDAPVVVFGYAMLPGAFEGILVTEGSKAQGIQDLVGKKIAVNRGGTGEYLLLKALDQAGIPHDKVDRVYLGPSDAASAFALAQVDAWAVWDPFNSIAQINHGARMLVRSDAVKSDNAFVTVVRANFLKEHRDVVEWVFATLREEDDWAIAHTDEASVMWSKAMGLSPEIGKMLAEHSNLPLTAVGAAQQAQIARAAGWMYEQKMIPAAADVPAHVVDFSNLATAPK